METFTLFENKVIDGFWAERQRINGTVTLQSVYDRFFETGRFEAMKCKVSEKEKHYFWDSDVAKWLEAAAYLLARKEDAQIRAWYNETVEDIISNQLPSGYFNSYFQTCDEEHFTKRDRHELYCAGHLFEAAVAASQYLNDNRLLTFSEKYVDYIYERFVEKKDVPFTTPGHEEIELALYRLYRLTGKEKYSILAKFFLDQRGQQAEYEEVEGQTFYAQSHLPIRQQFTAEGHAVRALYLYIAMADMAKIEKDEQLLEVLKSLFMDIVEKKMYVTGGTGSSFQGEKFTLPYDLPNFKAYSETCAAIALAFFCDRMMQLTGEAIYGHVFERVLYNALIAGVSLDGSSFFYVNPLEMQKEKAAYNLYQMRGYWQEVMPIIQRVKVFYCSCCPPNVCRFMEELPQFVWYKDENAGVLTLSQWISSSLHSDFVDAELVSDMPYSGKVRLKVDSHGRNILLRLRKPEWCDQNFDNEKDGYLVYDGVFNNEEIELEFPFTLKKIYSNPMIPENAGKVAFSYGPLILCAEGVDNKYPLSAIRVGEISNAQVEVLRGEPYAVSVRLPIKVRCTSNRLYSDKPFESKDATLRLIPYFTWANRGENDMQVWMCGD